AGAVGDLHSVNVRECYMGVCTDRSTSWLQPLSNFRPGSFALGWTSIVQTNNGVLFYRQSDGLQVMVDLDSNGGVTTRQRLQYLKPGYTAVVAAGSNILFYNAATGDAALGQILPNDRFVLPAFSGSLAMQWQRPGYFSPGWTH